MKKRNLMACSLFVAILLASSGFSCAENEVEDQRLVLGGIPLCGDPNVAKEFLAPVEKGARKKFEREWNSREWLPNKILQLKLSEPNIKVTLNGRQPSTLFIQLKDDRIHAVVARWRAKGTRGSFTKYYDELITKVRSALGEPDEVLESPRTSGWTGVQETETTFIWLEDDRETRVFDKRGDMKWYAAIQITCADTLREIVGAEDIF